MTVSVLQQRRNLRTSCCCWRIH